MLAEVRPSLYSLPPRWRLFSVGFRLVTNPWPLASGIGCGVATRTPKLPLFRGEHPRAPPVGMDRGSGPFLTRWRPSSKAAIAAFVLCPEAKSFTLVWERPQRPLLTDWHLRCVPVSTGRKGSGCGHPFVKSDKLFRSYFVVQRPFVNVSYSESLPLHVYS